MVPGPIEDGWLSSGATSPGYIRGTVPVADTVGTDSAEGVAEECGIPIRLYQDGHRRHMAHPSA
jgi:hypothetical protein